MLDIINKGIRLSAVEKIIRDCRAAGIEVSLQMMIGMPRETRDDVLRTIDFLITNRAAISQVTFNIYYLTPACDVFLNPAKFGISIREPNTDFKFFHNFSHLEQGLSRDEAREFLALYNILYDKKLLKEDLPQRKMFSDSKSYTVCASIGTDKASLCYDYSPQAKTGQLREISEAAHA